MLLFLQSGARKIMQMALNLGLVPFLAILYAQCEVGEKNARSILVHIDDVGSRIYTFWIRLMVCKFD